MSERKVQNDSTVNYGWPPRSPLSQLPTSPPIDKKEFRKIRPNKFGLSVKGNRRHYVPEVTFPKTNFDHRNLTVDNVNNYKPEKIVS